MLSYGHGAIYAQKAFQLLRVVGWERAGTVLPHLVPTIVYGTREDKLPYMRPFVRGLDATRPRRARRRAASSEPHWADDGTLLLGAARARSHRGGAWRAGRRVARRRRHRRRARHGRATAVSDRHAALRRRRRGRLPRRLRLARHHARPHVRQRHSLARRPGDVARSTRRRHRSARVVDRVPRPLDRPPRVARRGGGRARRRAARPRPRRLRRELQRASLLEAPRRSSSTPTRSRRAVPPRGGGADGFVAPLDATARFMAAPKLERFVAATVERSIDFLNGRTPRD